MARRKYLLETHFPERLKRKTMKVRSYYLPEDMITRIESIAGERDVGKSDVVRFLLEKGLNSYDQLKIKGM